MEVQYQEKKIKEEKGNNERSTESLLDGTGREALRDPPLGLSGLCR